MVMQEYQVLRQMLDNEQKRCIKKQLLDLKENIKKQQEHLYNLFLRANDNMINAIDLFLKSQMTAGQFKHISEARLKRNREAFDYLRTK
jgi:hypothetical protein